MPTLKLYLLNAWSGLTYQGLLHMKEYEAPQRRELRFSALLQEIKHCAPDVVMLNEANPLPAYGNRLAQQLQMDICWHMGVAGLKAGHKGLPDNLYEGDLIAAQKYLKLTYLARKKLAGAGVCGNRFSCHFSNITQALLSHITLPAGETVYLCATHWTAHPALGEEALQQLDALAAQWDFSAAQVKRTRSKLHRLQQIKYKEARRTLAFLEQNVPAGAPLILAGDFNSEPDWPELRMLLDSGFTPVPLKTDRRFSWDMAHNTNLQSYYLTEAKRRQNTLYQQLDAWEEQTRRTIDHVFVKNIPLAACRASLCTCEGLPIPPSDHFGVIATLQW